MAEQDVFVTMTLNAANDILLKHLELYQRDLSTNTPDIKQISLYEKYQKVKKLICINWKLETNRTI